MTTVNKNVSRSALLLSMRETKRFSINIDIFYLQLFIVCTWSFPKYAINGGIKAFESCMKRGNHFERRKTAFGFLSQQQIMKHRFKGEENKHSQPHDILWKWNICFDSSRSIKNLIPWKFNFFRSLFYELWYLNFFISIFTTLRGWEDICWCFASLSSDSQILTFERF